MTAVEVAAYLMNPAEDVIKFGDELTEGMWVLPESRSARDHPGATQDEQLRQQRFRKVTRLRVTRELGYNGGSAVTFVGEWIDGYQEVHRWAVTTAWLVKLIEEQP